MEGVGRMVVHVMLGACHAHARQCAATWLPAKACARLLALVWLDAPDLTDPEELPEAPCDAGGDLVALYGPPPPPPSSAARAGELAFDLADNVYDRDAFRAVFVKAAAAGPLPWP